jgi:hypothetical protein
MIPIAETNINGIENFKIFVLNGVEINFFKSNAINFFRKNSINIITINADRNVGIRIAIFGPNIR